MEAVKITVDSQGVAQLTLARPEKHNALSAEMIAEVTAAATRLGRDPSVRVVVLRAEGESFCAGGDLTWMKAQIEADPATRAREATKLAMMFNALNEMPKPLIGRIHGNAFGGGLGLASVCDVAIGAASARFGLTETRLGLIPATIGPYVLARMGEAMARRVFMSARLFDSNEAVTLGLLAKSVSPDALDRAVAEEVTPYLSCAPGAVADAKRLARRLGPKIDDSVIAESIAALVERWETPEAKAGIAAFLERRKPDWIS